MDFRVTNRVHVACTQTSRHSILKYTMKHFNNFIILFSFMTILLGLVYGSLIACVLTFNNNQVYV